MAASVEIIRSLYDAFARGDVGAVLGVFDDAVHWQEAEGYRLAAGNPYVGPQAVAAGVFQPLVTDVEGFTVTPGRFVDGGDTVVVEGRYRGRVTATGTQLDAQFAHVWDLRGGKVVRFQQYTDTRQWAEAMPG
jgi:ketosteroid isomerase-like protein